MWKTPFCKSGHNYKSFLCDGQLKVSESLALALLVPTYFGVSFVVGNVPVMPCIAR